MRNLLIIGNWKLHGSHQMIIHFVTELCKGLTNISSCTVAIAPPEIYLFLAKSYIRNCNIALSAQNVDINLSGAFTGETSAEMLKNIGVRYVIIGHSERRTYHKESDDFIAKKFMVLKSQGIIPILCIGETEKEYKTGKTEEVCSRQIDAILRTYGITAFKDTVIAYEPIWAIGTGKAATPDQAQSVHQFIREYIATIDIDIAKSITIQYGGSVNVSNARQLFSQPDIDGALIGSASLNVHSFLKIIQIAEKIRQL